MTIELKGMRFKAFHGCLAQERLYGNEFEVDFRAEVPFALKSIESDCLDDTLDYGIIFDIIDKEMEHPSNLLESVAGRIIKAIARRFPDLEDVTVRVSKSCPPVGGNCEWSRVTLTRQELGI